MNILLNYFKTFCVFFFFSSLIMALYNEYQPKQPDSIEQVWIKEDVACYYSGSRVVNCETVRVNDP